MKFDQQNMFYDAKSTITTSDVILNKGGGDAENPLFLVIFSDGAETSALTFTLKTSDVEAFTTSETMETITTGTGKGIIWAGKLPYGAKTYLRLSSSSTPVGNITAGLVETVPNLI